MDISVEKLHKTLNIKRKNKYRKYNSLKGIGKTTLFLENLTQLGLLVTDKVNIFPIFSKTLSSISIIEIHKILKMICDSKNIKYKRFVEQQEGVQLFAVDNIILMFVYKVTDNNRNAISTILSEKTSLVQSSYILNECLIGDLSDEMRKLITKNKLKEIKFT